MSKWGLFGLVFSVGVAALVSPLASPLPDALERVATNLGFADMAVETPLAASPMAEYLFPWVSNNAIATALAGLLGTLVMFGAAAGLARILRVRKDKTDAS